MLPERSTARIAGSIGKQMMAAPARHFAGIATPASTQACQRLVAQASSPSPPSPSSSSPSAISSLATRRHNASSSSSAFGSHSSSRQLSSSSYPSSSSSSPSGPPALTWNQFLQQRKARRRYNLVASVSTGMGTAFGGAGYLSTIDLNQLSGVLFGIDPFMALGLSTMACGAFGWLIGPLAGTAVFNLTHRSSGKEMLEKEKDFFHRIAKYRADISAGGNLQNTPFPDYYGEKIDSVAGYRQWLRDQRKFSKKREYREK